jgi:hypothetical protein
MLCLPKCGYAAELSNLAASGRLVCRCPHPLDFAVQNGKGPTSSNHCARCGLPLTQKRRFHPNTDAVDPDVRWAIATNASRSHFKKIDGKWRIDRTDRAEVVTRWLDVENTVDHAEQLRAANAENNGRPLPEVGGGERHMGSTHANAAQFVAWLDGQGLTLGQQDQKKAAEWRRGSRRITIATVDRIMTGFGRHLSELPDEVFE